MLNFMAKKRGNPVFLPFFFVPANVRERYDHDHAIVVNP